METHEFKRIGIMGAGSLGIVLGAYIAEQRQVDLIVSSKGTRDALNTNGARVVGKINKTVPVNALRAQDMEGTYDLFLYMVKQTANSTAIPMMLDHSHDQTVVCTFQNGLPELAVSEAFTPDRTVGAPVSWGATSLEPGVSMLNTPINEAYFALGSMTQEGSKYLPSIKNILELMCTVHTSDDLLSLRWSKLVINTVMTGTSTAIGGSFGKVFDNDWALKRAAYVGRETIKVISASGVSMGSGELDFSKIFSFEGDETISKTMDSIKKLWGGSRQAVASMRQDLLKGRKCEIDSVNGIVVDVGKKHGVPTPMNDLIVDIIHAKEAGTIQVNASCKSLFEAKLAEIEAASNVADHIH
ncbi:MAG: 2-dehydropantoate 2-reductase [Methanobacterium sp.]|nr:2-dehydropantoate 2-reductase [Methanobacterium sp.]